MYKELIYKTIAEREFEKANREFQRKVLNLLSKDNIIKYSEDQPRDENGRFTDGGITKDNINDYIANPKKLFSKYTPKTLKSALEQGGFEVKTLKRGSLKGVDFTNGGGYKVNFGDDGLLQYHPASGSHHGGAYYKISTGKGGIHHYELDGKEKK